MTNNAVAVPGSAKFANAMAAMSNFAPSGKAYMKFNANTGRYSYGKDDTEISAGSEAAVNMATFSTGWVCWKDGEVAKELMARPLSGEVPENEADLPDLGPYENEEDGWKKQVSVDMRLLDDSGAGEEIIFKTSSKGGIGGISKLFREYCVEASLKGDGIVPIVSFDNTSYMPKNAKHGKKHAPVFKVVEYTTEQALIASLNQGENPENYAEAPKKLEAPAPESKGTTPAPAAAETSTPGSRRKRF
jgi:hypothetical protein